LEKPPVHRWHEGIAHALVDELLYDRLFCFPAERTALVRPLLAGEDLLGTLPQLTERLLVFGQGAVEAGAARYSYKGIAVELRVGEIVGALETLALVQQALGQVGAEPRRIELSILVLLHAA